MARSPGSPRPGRASVSETPRGMAHGSMDGEAGGGRVSRRRSRTRLHPGRPRRRPRGIRRRGPSARGHLHHPPGRPGRGGGRLAWRAPGLRSGDAGGAKPRIRPRLLHRLGAGGDRLRAARGRALRGGGSVVGQGERAESSAHGPAGRHPLGRGDDRRRSRCLRGRQAHRSSSSGGGIVWTEWSSRSWPRPWQTHPSNTAPAPPPNPECGRQACPDQDRRPCRVVARRAHAALGR